MQTYKYALILLHRKVLKLREIELVGVLCVYVFIFLLV